MGNKESAVISDEEIKILAQRTGLTIDEVQKQYIDFIQAFGSDGKISQKEFKTTMKKLQPKMSDDENEKLLKYVFRMFDIDGSGGIDYKEYMTVCCLLVCDNMEERLKMIFRIYDTNQDKSISRKEVGKIVDILFALLSYEEKKAGSESVGKSESKRRKEMAEKVFKEMDRNCDNEVATHEFIGAMNKANSVSRLLTVKLSDLVGIKLENE